MTGGRTTRRPSWPVCNEARSWERRWAGQGEGGRGCVARLPTRCITVGRRRRHAHQHGTSVPTMTPNSNVVEIGQDVDRAVDKFFSGFPAAASAAIAREHVPRPSRLELR